MADTMTPGALLAILKEEQISNPVIQVISIKNIAPQPDSQQSRFRLMISDSKYQHNSSLMTGAPGITELKELPAFSVIRLTRFQTCQVNRNNATGNNIRKVILVISFEMVASGETIRTVIGTPTNVEEYMEKIMPQGPGRISNGGANTSRPAVGDVTLQEGLTFPITSLSPYQNRWVIKARVTAKTGIKTWSNARGEGKLFSIDLKDETGEIRATAFKNEVDRFFDNIHVDKVYYLSKCQLKTANRQYSTLKNDYEMTFTPDTVVQECVEPVSSIPGIQYSFVPISQIANMETNAIIDVIGVVKSCGDLQSFTSRNGRDLQKRDVTLVDNSNASVSLTLWAEQAANFDPYSQPILQLKSVRVTEFNGGKSIGLVGSSSMKLNPESSEAVRLRAWFESGAAENITVSVSARSGGTGNFTTEWMTFEDAKNANLGAGDKADYFQCKALVHNIRMQNAVYKACPQAECNKKLIDQENSTYRCEKCNTETSNFKYRLLLSVLLGDWTGNRYVTCFTEVAEQLLGKSAQEIGEALDGNQTEAEEIFQSVQFKNFVFKLRSKLEYFGDSPRNKLTVVQMSPVNYKEYNSYLMKELETLTGIGKN